jgi:predicted transcriptional regulator
MRNLTEKETKIVSHVGSGNRCALAIAHLAQMPYQEANKIIERLNRAGVLSRRVNTDWTLSKVYIDYLKQENDRLSNRLNLAS